ncbi:MAG TPA: outer membrane beta-barrel protein [Longimicrobiales bacterium]|nr:outer membrane beta-barrel protein [Longimicrobiales bacterium]
MSGWRRDANGRGAAGRWAAVLVAVLVAALVWPPGMLEAQELPPPEIGLVGGTFSYDLGVRGDATSPFGGLRVRFPLSRHLLVEPGLALTRLTADSVSEGADRDITFLLMEFQAQVQLPVDRLRPYLGVGAGGMLDLRGARGIDEFMVSTYSVAAGLAVDLGSSWAIRTEVRGRAIDDDAHSAFELGLALSTTF